MEAIQCLLCSFSQWNPAESLVHVFVTFVILSYCKFLFVSFTLQRSAYIHNITDIAVGPRVLYYDASMVFFSQERLPFFLAIFVLLTFNFLPLWVVVLYPTRVCQKCLNCCRIRWHAVHAFADAFNGCYKDGTNGTWDYRYFAGFYLLLRLLFFINYINIRQMVLSNLINVCLVGGILLFVLCRPYKKNLFNILDSFFFLLALLQHYQALSYDTITILFAVVLLLYFVVHVLSKVLLKVQCQCFLNLKSFVDRVTDEQILQTNREETQGSDLPDRLVNPEGYRLLSEPATQRGDQNSCDNTRPVPTYGIV